MYINIISIEIEDTINGRQCIISHQYLKIKETILNIVGGS